MIYPQMLLDIHGEIICDLFAGGGGASLGIELATGRMVDVAVNHDPIAVAMHELNHPQTRHERADVFEVDPREVTKGRRVGLLWASPDCTYFSKSRGGKPLRDAARKRRALAWVVTRWAGQVRPRVIALENVEEFADWGPLIGPPDNLQPCPRRKGRTFRQWVRSLERLGYEVEWRELRACDYGAPTIRKRLFVIARCDGRPIVWPEPTHGPGTNRPYRSAAECIDWSIPMLSIFATREEAKRWARAWREAGVKMGTPVRPLAKATMRRCARGVMRYVVQAANPFIVNLAQRGPRQYPMTDPLRTQHAGGNAFGLVVPSIVGVGGRMGQSPPRGLGEPYQTITAKGDAALVAAFLAKNFTGVVGSDLREPKGTVTTIDHDALVAAHLSTMRNSAKPYNGANEPVHTITAGGAGISVVAAFLQSYYGNDQDAAATDPLATITTKDRHALVTVEIQGEPYVITDIAMRMLQPRELYRAQGFPDSYIIDRGADGRRLTKTEQVRLVGNSVAPPVAAALVRANVPELIARDAARVA